MRAVLFCLCNGRDLKVYRSDRLPESALIYEAAYDDFEAEFDTILNLLSPEAMMRSYPEVEIDEGKPLAPGLRSMAQIAGGYFRYTSITPPNPALSELFFSILCGARAMRER